MTNPARLGIYAALAILVLAPLPSAVAHGPVNAREVEVLVLKDELSDFQTSLAGYDLGEFYIAEAWIPGLGDGFYFHTIFFGAFPGRPPADEYEVVFTLEDGEGQKVTRRVLTTDGTTFTTDFDLFEATAESDQIEVERAFISFASSGWHVGSTIKSFVVESFADGQLRDRAPGGVYVPGSGGALEFPMQGSSSQVVESFVFGGPVKYAKATFNAAAESDMYKVNITSLLTEGEQHVHLAVPEWALEDASMTGWSFEIMGSPGGEVLASGARDVTFRLQPVPDESGAVPPQMINVTTDIGGRLGFQVRALPGGGVEFVPEANITDWKSAQVGSNFVEAPGIGLLPALLGLVAVIAATASRRGRF